MIRGGDFSMLKVWVGLEARSFLQASIDTVRVLDILLEFIANSCLGGAICQVRSTLAEHIEHEGVLLHRSYLITRNHDSYILYQLSL